MRNKNIELDHRQNQEIDLNSEIRKSRKIFAIGVACVVLIILGAFVPVNIFRGFLLGNIVVGCLILIDLVALYLLIQEKYTAVAVNLIIGLASAGLVLFNFLEGGPFAPGLVWISAIPLLMIYLVGVKSALFWVLGLISCVLAINIWSFHNGFPGRLDSSQAAITLIFGATLAPLGAFSISYLFAKHIKFMQGLVNKKNKQLDHITQGLSETLNDRNALITVVCHDIATPLSTINFSTTVLQEYIRKNYPDDPKLAKWIDKIEKSAAMMDQGITLTRELMAIDSGKKEIQVTKIDLKEILSKTKALYEDRIAKKELSIVVDIENEDQNYQVLAEERALLFSVFGNVLSNAIKFSSKGGKIEIKLLEEMASHIRVEFRDYGKGIPKDNLINMFSWHKNSSTNGSIGEAGTGFGMPATKDWMEKFNGKIHLISHYAASSQPIPIGLSKEEKLNMNNVDIEFKEANEVESGAEFKLIFPKAS